MRHRLSWYLGVTELRRDPHNRDAVDHDKVATDQDRPDDAENADAIPEFVELRLRMDTCVRRQFQHVDPRHLGLGIVFHSRILRAVDCVSQGSGGASGLPVRGNITYDTLYVSDC